MNSPTKMMNDSNGGTVTLGECLRILVVHAPDVHRRQCGNDFPPAGTNEEGTSKNVCVLKVVRTFWFALKETNLGKKLLAGV